MKPVLQILSVFLSCGFFAAQQPAPPANSPPPSPSGASTSSKAPETSKQKAIPSFLIIGTVFDEKALSFPGVQVRVRRSDEKKFRWETYTDSRGEFAVRVLPGHEYEVVTHAKKYKDESRKVDSTVDVQQRLSIKLEPVNQATSGAKP